MYICTKCNKECEPKVKRARQRYGRSDCCNAKWIKKEDK